MKTSDNKYSFSVYILIIIIIVYSALLISGLQHVRFTGDFTLYLDIAKKYLQGNFTDAVNGYWGPMFSWLLIPFLYFGASSVFAINALNLIIGALTAAGVWILSFRFDISEKIRNAILISLLPVILFMSIVEFQDFLLSCLLVYYLGIIFNNTYQTKILNGVLCGILGAFAYLTKPYAFPFFIVHFTSMNIIHLIRCSTKKEKGNVLRNLISGIIIFSIISGAWITAISTKYNRFTFSNMGKGNFAALAPELPDSGYELGNPLFYEGFFPPSNKTAVSAWEDPSYVMNKLPDWNPVESVSYLKHFIKNIMKNFMECIRIFGSFSRLSYVIVLVYILLLIVQLFSKQILRGDMFYSFFTLLLFTGGYMPFHLELRYLWIDNILLLLMGGYVLMMLFQNSFFQNNLRKNFMIIFFSLSFMLTPLKSFVQEGHNNLNEEMHNLSLILSEKYTIKGNIASNREWTFEPIHDSWHKTFRLAHHLNSRYYGQAKEPISERELESEFKKYNIDYYFIWGESQNIPKFLSKHKELTKGEFSDLRIYSLKEKIK
jgi:hypothetical protein